MFHQGSKSTKKGGSESARGSGFQIHWDSRRSMLLWQWPNNHKETGKPEVKLPKQASKPREDWGRELLLHYLHPLIKPQGWTNISTDDVKNWQNQRWTFRWKGLSQAFSSVVGKQREEQQVRKQTKGKSCFHCSLNKLNAWNKLERFLLTTVAYHILMTGIVSSKGLRLPWVNRTQVVL